MDWFFLNTIHFIIQGEVEMEIKRKLKLIIDSIPYVDDIEKLRETIKHLVDIILMQGENKMEPYLVRLEKEIDNIKEHMPDNAGLLAISYAMIGVSQALENASRRWEEAHPKLWEGE